MKSYEEIAERVLHRRDCYEKKRLCRSRIWKRTVCAVSCVCVVALAGVGMWKSGVFGHGTPRWQIKELPGTGQTGGELAVDPKWEEMTVSQQFAELCFRSAVYSSRVTELAPETVGELLWETEMRGQDSYTGKQYRISAEVYAIQGVSEACAVAVRFAQGDGYYVYVNPYYRPETLGQFIEDLNLTEHLFFGSVWYSYYDQRADRIVLVEFENVADSVIWEMLLSNRTLETIGEPIPTGSCEMSVSVSIPLLGYENIALTVNEEGSLSTNILDTGKYFFVGTELASRFMEYVIQNYTGYEIRYTDSFGSAVPE